MEITDAIQQLVDSGNEVHPHLVTGWCKETGEIEDILRAKHLILERFSGSIKGKIDGNSKIDGRVDIESDVLIRDSHIRSPVILGSGSQILNSLSGPFTSIHRNSQVIETEVENSIILEGSEIKDIEKRINESLIGREVKINRGKPKTAVYRFRLGDKSEIRIK